MFNILTNANCPALVSRALLGDRQPLSLAEASRLVTLWSEHSIKSSEAAGSRKGWKLNYNELDHWAEEIVECFPGEITGAWFKRPPSAGVVTPKVDMIFSTHVY